MNLVTAECMRIGIEPCASHLFRHFSGTFRTQAVTVQSVLLDGKSHCVVEMNGINPFYLLVEPTGSNQSYHIRLHCGPPRGHRLFSLRSRRTSEGLSITIRAQENLGNREWHQIYADLFGIIRMESRHLQRTAICERVSAGCC